jgi:hypothetical protein
VSSLSASKLSDEDTFSASLSLFRYLVNQKTSFGGTQFWLLIVDDATNQSFQLCLKKKSDAAQTIVNLIKHLKEKERIEVKMLRCDNAGENKSAKNHVKVRVWVSLLNTPPQTPLNITGELKENL